MADGFPDAPLVTELDNDVRFRLQFSTVRIEADSSLGTGFIFSFDRSNAAAMCIVTNRHVVEGTQKLRFRFTKTDNGVPLVGQSVLIEIDASNAWIPHPDGITDLAIIPLQSVAISRGTVDGVPIIPGTLNIHVCILNLEDIPPPEHWPLFTSAEEILMVGYPIGIADRVNNMPIFRRGISATSPGYDYEGKSEFVVDLACFPGSSGSPVFAYKPPLLMKSSNASVTITGTGAHVRLLGILYGGPRLSVTGQVTVDPIPTSIVGDARMMIPSHLGYAIKSTKLHDFLPIVASFKPAPEPQIPDAGPV